MKIELVPAAYMQKELTEKIIAYFEGHWDHTLDIITSFQCINFNKKYSRLFIEAIFKCFK